MTSFAAPDIAYMFDLGGVIVTHDNHALYQRIASRCATTSTMAGIAQAAEDALYTTGAHPISHLHARLVREARYAGDWPCFVADWSSHFGVNLSMLDFVETLAAQRRVLLFSNTNHEHWSFLVDATGGRLGRLEAYLSHELGLMKPTPSAFVAVAERAGLDPRRTLFIDDIEANVEGARQAGFLATRFVNEATLRQDLAGP